MYASFQKELSQGKNHTTRNANISTTQNEECQLASPQRDAVESEIVSSSRKSKE